jgi:hypothetical protein
MGDPHTRGALGNLGARTLQIDRALGGLIHAVPEPLTQKRSGGRDSRLLGSLRSIARGGDDSQTVDVVYSLTLFTASFQWRYSVLLQSLCCGVVRFGTRRLVKMGKYALQNAGGNRHNLLAMLSADYRLPMS